jgi:hypothetical protein
MNKWFAKPAMSGRRRVTFANLEGEIQSISAKRASSEKSHKRCWLPNETFLAQSKMANASTAVRPQSEAVEAQFRSSETSSSCGVNNAGRN